VDIDHRPSEDTLVITLSPTLSTRTEELSKGVFFLYAPGGKLVGIRIDQASERVDLVEKLSLTEEDTGVSPTADFGDQPSVTIFSDGACSGNPGPGGWGTRLKYPDGRIVELGGFVPDTTNNRMELTAALQGLERAGKIPSITLITDSEYLRKGITEWIHGWKRRGWITAAKKPVLNQDLWRQLDRLNGPHITWKYTRGHAGDPDNERCDDIAQSFSQGETPAMRTE
jgi:ribonuclease HI